MDTVTAREAKNTFGDTLLKAVRSPVRITRNGKPIAVMLSVENYLHSEELKLAELRRMAERADKEMEAGDFTDGEMFMKEIIDGI
jgi:prevent-host-death family protein